MNSHIDPHAPTADWIESVDQTLAPPKNSSASCPEPLRRLFQQNDAPAPQVLWRPEMVDLIDSAVYAFASYAKDHMDADGQVPASAFAAPGRLRHFSDWLVVTRMSDDAEDFRYEYYGPAISQMYGRDLKGTMLSERANHIASFYAAMYRAAAARREWVLTVHEPPGSVFVQTWRRLIIPLVEDDGRVQRFAAVNVPQNTLRAGLEAVPDPALVLDGDQRVRFSNSAARNLLGLATEHLGEPLFEATGIALPEGVSASSLDATGTVRTQACLTINHGIVASVTVTASATRLGNRPFMLLIVRPEG